MCIFVVNVRTFEDKKMSMIYTEVKAALKSFVNP